MRLSTILWFVAGALALAAVAISYVRHGEIRWGIAAAGVFLIAMGVSSLSRQPHDAATKPPAQR